MGEPRPPWPTTRSGRRSGRSRTPSYTAVRQAEELAVDLRPGRGLVVRVSRRGMRSGGSPALEHLGRRRRAGREVLDQERALPAVPLGQLRASRPNWAGKAWWMNRTCIGRLDLRFASGCEPARRSNHLAEPRQAGVLRERLAHRRRGRRVAERAMRRPGRPARGRVGEPRPRRRRPGRAEPGLVVVEELADGLGVPGQDAPAGRHRLDHRPRHRDTAGSGRRGGRTVQEVGHDVRRSSPGVQNRDGIEPAARSSRHR